MQLANIYDKRKLSLGSGQPL